MDVTALFGINITVTLGVALLLWRGLSARVDGLKDHVADRVDGLRDRVAAEHAGLSARLNGLSTQVDGLTTGVDGLATSVGRIEGWLEHDRMERRDSESAP